MRNYLKRGLVNFMILIVVLPNFIKSGVINLPYNNENAVVGLYNNTDKVIVLNYNNLKDNIFNASYSSLLEFYNSFCGHCRRFAPTYKQLAFDLSNWSNIIKVMAIDCADDQNNDVCREFEIMSYPTLRYFSPNSINSNLVKSKTIEQNGEQTSPADINTNNNIAGNLGVPIRTQNIQAIRDILLESIEKESQPVNNKLWPNFNNFNKGNLDNFFKTNLNNEYKYGILLYDLENSTFATNLTLNFNIYDEILIRKTTFHELTDKFAFGLRTILFFERSASGNNGQNLQRIEAEEQSDLEGKLIKFLNEKNIKPNLNYLSEFEDKLNNKTKNKTNPTSTITKDEILNQVKYDKNKIYQADLENALKYTIFHEIIKYTEISGERLLALQSYISALVKYNPLGENGKQFLKDLKNYIMDHNQKILGIKLKEELIKIELKHQPIFSSSQWVGCINTKQGLRGFTCGLWQLFHFMTVQAAENEKSQDPLEVLKAMHDYVKYFFGCTDCSNHFQEMAKRRKIWATLTKDDAVLFLWGAHNEVNKRLSGDDTEDPAFPKIQYPSKYSCTECYRDEPLIDNETNWNKQNVLEFLKRTYNLPNISRYGVDDDSILPSKFDKYMQKRGFGIVFSEIDLRMGILLYGFCILMMILAVKLFLYKGYRKKSYSPNNNFVGKI